MNLKTFCKNLISLASCIKSNDLIFWNYHLKKCKDSKIDPNCKLYPPYNISNSTILHSTYINVNSRISFTHIGKYCSIGPNFLSGWGIHPTNGISTSPIFYSSVLQASYTLSKSTKLKERKDIHIGSDVFIGANVTILDGVTIGDGAIIGAGAVVSKDIPPYAIAVGCPIKILRYRFSEKIIQKLLEIKWWDSSDIILKDVETNFFDVERFIKNFENQ